MVGILGNPAYVSSKHAVNGLTKKLALDYVKFNIKVNSVSRNRYSYGRREQAIANGEDPAQAQYMAGQKTQTI